ncbi:MAG: DUF4185 domain-containing protein, partial [Bifidobacteriaceae bacterium]|nr:DUF4185 domain-containing protein [Bifidobacteriaceae bacterium]
MNRTTRRTFTFLATAGLAVGGVTALVTPPAQGAPPIPPSPAIVIAKMTSARAVTPTNNNTFGNITGTDLGILWDLGNGEVGAAFGDTYSRQTTSGNWRCSSLLFSTDTVLDDGLAWSSVLKASGNYSSEIVPCNKDASGGGAIKPGEHSAIPTSAIAVQDPSDPTKWRSFVAYMSNTGFGDPGVWGIQYNEVYYSDDFGRTWNQSPLKWLNTSATSPDGYHPFQMVGFGQRPGDQWVYMMGTGPGRLGPAALSRVKAADLYAMDQSKFEYWIDGAWIDSAQDPQADSHATPVIEGQVSELGLAWNEYTNSWVTMYLKDNRDIVLRTAPRPEGPWTEATIVMNADDYPQLYGGFMHPWSLGNTPDIYFSMSDWRAYNVYLVRVSLNRNGTVANPNLLVDPNFERQGSSIGAPWQTTAAATGIDRATDSANSGIRAFSGGTSPWIRLDGSGAVDPGTVVSLWQKVAVKPHTAYRLAAWAQMDTDSASGTIEDAAIGVRVPEGGAVIAQSTFNRQASYLRQYVEFETGENTSVEVFVNGVTQTLNPWLNVDAFSLVELGLPIGLGAGDSTDKSELAKTVASASALEETDFTATSWLTLGPALADAESVNEDDFASQEEIDASATALTEAVAGLLPRGNPAGLAEAIALADDLLGVADLYTAPTVAALRNALGDARAVYDARDDLVQAPLTAAAQSVHGAIAALRPEPDTVGPLAVLGDLIAQVGGLESTVYTPASWNDLNRALVAAMTVAADSTANAAAIHAAVTALANAVVALEYVAPAGSASGSAAVAALRASVSAVATLTAADYDPASWTRLTQALAQANAVLAAASPSNDDVEAARAALGAAIDLLRPNSAAEVAPLPKDNDTGQIVRVKASQGSVTLVKGKSVALSAWAYSDTGAKTAVSWASANKNVATVSKAGKINAKKAGKTTVTATVGGKKAVVKVTVVAKKPSAKVTRISVSGIPATMVVGQAAWIAPKYVSAKTAGVKVTYKSSNSAVLTVDKAGALIAKAPGDATITVKA